jgi:hypothetical protein
LKFDRSITCKVAQNSILYTCVLHSNTNTYTNIHGCDNICSVSPFFWDIALQKEAFCSGPFETAWWPYLQGSNAPFDLAKSREAVTHSGGPLSPRNDAQTAPLRKPQKSQYRFGFVQTRDRRLIVSQDISVKLKPSPIHVSFYPTDIAQLTLPFFRELTIYLHNS